MQSSPGTHAWYDFAVFKAVRKLWFLGLISSLGCVSPDAQQPPPNIVLITVDALRADFVSYAGHPNRTTPVLDAFADQNVVFTQAVTSYPGTAPSMSSLMTGLYPSFETVEAWTKATRHGFNEFETPEEVESPGLSDNLRMLAEILGDNGYQTLGFNTNPNLSKNANFHQGFDEYSQFLPYLKKVRADRTHRLHGNYPPAPVVVAGVLNRVQEGFERPVFLWMHLMEPHSPYLPPPEYARRFDRTDSGFTDLEINESLYHLLYTQQGSLRAARRFPSPDARGLDRDAFVDHLLGLYEGEIRFLDDQLHVLFEGLREHDLWDNTLVVVTSDHGEEFLDHDRVAHHEITGLYEELIRIPLVFKTPNGRPSGVVVDELVRMVDIAPTILDYAGHPELSTDMEGLSLMPLAEGVETTPRTAFYSTIHFNIVRDGRWKYRLEKRAAADGEPLESLFDIVLDPMEEHDVAGQYPERVEGMRRRYAEFAESLAHRKPPADAIAAADEKAIDDEELERLEALGYIEN